MPFYTPVDFDYYAPRNVDEAVTLLSEKEDSVIIAGGQTLLTLLKLRILRPKNVIDLSKVSSLRYIKEENGEIRIGAITVHNEVARSQLIASRCGLLSAAAGRIGDEQVRNRGTIGGSVANADPSANYEPVLLALDARFTLIGPQGRREVGAREFFVDAYTTAINKGEVLTEVKVRELSEVGYSFKKAARREQEFAIVNVAALLWLEGDEIKDVRVAVGGVTARPERLDGVEEALIGKGKEAIPSALSSVEYSGKPISDVRASSGYREYLSKIYLRRALEEAYARAKGVRS